MSESDRKNVTFGFSDKLAQSILDELENDQAPATVGDIARIHAAQLQLFDYCFAVYVLAVLPDEQIKDKARSEAILASNRFTEAVKSGLYNVIDRGSEDDV